MKITLKSMTLAGVLGAVLLATAAPSFAATRHHHQSNASEAYGSAIYPTDTTNAPLSQVPEASEGN